VSRSKWLSRILLCIVASVPLALPGVAGAAQLMVDRFEYANGNLVGVGGWLSHSGAGSIPIQVSDKSAIVTPGGGSREDVNKAFAVQLATATTFAQFSMLVKDTTSLATSDYIAHFRPSANPTFFRARVYVARDSANAGRYKIGIGATSAGTLDQSTIYFPGSYALGQRVKVATSYNGVTGESRLWVDPADDQAPFVSRTVAAAANDAMDSYCFRQGGNPLVTIVVHDLYVGQSLADVLDKPIVPSASQAGMISLAALLAGGAWFAIRRRSAVAQS